MKKITYTESMARRIQNWGEQDERIHNAEMIRWRKIWKMRALKKCVECGNKAMLGDYCKECAKNIPL